VFTQAALTVLSAPAWPGNLDELRLVLDRVLGASADGAIRQEEVLAHLPIDRAFARIAPQISLREARRQFEREYIASVLERHRWRMSEAARTLGIERANLYRKTRQLGIMRRAGAPIAS
jgi:two-component system nitrogen regulation response regulator NtrX